MKPEQAAEAPMVGSPDPRSQKDRDKADLEMSYQKCVVYFLYMHVRRGGAWVT